MNTILWISERPSAPPATAVFGVLDAHALGDLVAVCPPRPRAEFGERVAVDTAHLTVERLAAPRTAHNGRSVSAPTGGYAVSAQRMGKKQINVGTTGVGGAPPRGRPL